MKDLDTPVALVVFNRPEETARVFEAVRAARPPRLLVVADGPRPDHPQDEELVARTRDVVAAVDWPCEVLREYADRNLGCGARVSSGLDWVFGVVDEAIVLEDDCLPHPSFFSFAETMLARYRDDERIGMVAGMNYFSDPALGGSWFFSNYFPVWGWASWSRAWRSYDAAMTAWPGMRERGHLAAVYGNAGLAAFVGGMFDAAHRGELDTWDVQWVYSCLAQRRMCVVPRVNLVTNIGFRGTREPGESVGLPSSDFGSPDPIGPSTMLPDLAYEDRLYAERLRAPLRRRTLDAGLLAAQRAKAALGRRAAVPRA